MQYDESHITIRPGMVSRKMLVPWVLLAVVQLLLGDYLRLTASQENDGITTAVSFTPSPIQVEKGWEPGVVIVRVVIALEMPREKFTMQVQTRFTQALALCASVDASKVRVAEIQRISTRRMRRLLTDILTIDVEIAAKDSSAAKALARRLRQDSINVQLKRKGLPASKIIQTATIVNDTGAESGLVQANIFAAIFILTAMVIVYWNVTRKHGQDDTKTSQTEAKSDEDSKNVPTTADPQPPADAAENKLALEAVETRQKSSPASDGSYSQESTSHSSRNRKPVWRPSRTLKTYDDQLKGLSFSLRSPSHTPPEVVNRPSSSPPRRREQSPPQHLTQPQRDQLHLHQFPTTALFVNAPATSQVSELPYRSLEGRLADPFLA